MSKLKVTALPKLEIIIEADGDEFIKLSMGRVLWYLKKPKAQELYEKLGVALK